MGYRLAGTIDALVGLGEHITAFPPDLELCIASASARNSWFTPGNCRCMLEGIASEFLEGSKLKQWASRYDGRPAGEPKRIGVVAAGNLPLVAFHDVLAVLVSGHFLMLKSSAKDDVLLPYFLGKLIEIGPLLKNRICMVERLVDFDAVIATGNDNSARYFEFYFGRVPHVIRKNRNSVAVLTGMESALELEGLAGDVFQYFGLGCRNVSKLYITADYDLDALKPAFEKYRYVFDHSKYRNNLDYNRTMLLMANIPFHDIDFINIIRNTELASPIANLHYEYYNDLEDVEKSVSLNRAKIQCVVGHVPGICTVPFGRSQRPGLSDYADDVDIMQFLSELT